MSKNMRLKREMAKVLSVALVSSMVVMPVMASDYSNHWAKEAIEKWSEKGIITGYEDGNFRPKNNLTRGELAAFLVRVFGLTETKEAKKYEDVAQTKWYAADVAKVSAAGIMNDENASFRPDDYATREEAVYALAKAYKVTGDSQQTFNDVTQISDWAATMVEAMVAGGYISGRPDGNFAPQDLLTRADIITMLDKITADFIGKSGTYIQDVAGNLVVNAENVVLKNMTVQGNIYITQGVGSGEVILDNVTAEGSTYIEGGSTTTLTGKFAEVIVSTGAKVQLKGAIVDKIIVVGTSKDDTKAVIEIDQDSKVIQLIADAPVQTIVPALPTTSTGNSSSQTDDTTINTKGITLDITEVTLKANETKQLTATVNPTNATNKNVTWTSNNLEVATVDGNGKVTALNPGTAVIIVTTQSGKHTATCKINVGIDTSIITEGATYTVTTDEVTPAGLVVELPFKNHEDMLNVTYTELEKVEGFSLEGETVTVTNAAENGGVYTLEYTVVAGGRIVTGKVEITATNEIAEVESVTLDQSEVILKVAEEVQLVATINPTDATNQEVVWTSSDESVVIVDANGKVTAVAPGEAVVAVTTQEGNYVAACKVKVGVDLGIVTEGATYAVTTKEVTPAGLVVELPFKNHGDMLNVTYTELEKVEGFSLAGETVTVTNAAKNGGVYTLEYTVVAGGRIVTGKVEITATNEIAEVESITLDQSEVILKVAEEVQLVATINPEDATNQQVVWTSSDENVVTVDANGRVTAIGTGSAVVKVVTQEGNFEAVCTIKVGVNSVVVEPGNYNLVTKEVTPAGFVVDLPFKTIEGSFSVNYTEVESVEGFVLEAETVKVLNTVLDGTVYTLNYAVVIGEKTITGTIKITAINEIIEVEGVSLNQDEVTLQEGESTTLAALINPTNATNQTMIWTSSDENIATVDQEGQVIAVGEGIATITVTTQDGDFTAICLVTVEAEKVEQVIPVQSVKLNYEEVTIKKGESLQLIATVAPFNATNKNVIWKLIGNKVILDTDTGMITGKSKGTSQIEVTTEDGEYKAICNVTVETK